MTCFASLDSDAVTRELCYRVERICSWCKAVMGHAMHDKPGQTHGICQACRDREFPRREQ